MPNLVGGAGFVVVFDDKIGEDRQHMTMVSFCMQLDELAEQYGFKIRLSGPYPSMRQSMADVQRGLDNQDMSDMLTEYRSKLAR